MQPHVISQLAHVELLSPRPAETEEFFTRLLGLQVTHREGQSAYLRAYQDTFHHSLVITEAPTTGMGHAAWRTTSAETLESTAKAIDATGLGDGWADAGVGHGRAYTFRTPDGHRQELLWEVDRYRPTPAETSASPVVVQKKPLQGVPVRRIDHLNLMAADLPATKAFFEEHLTFRTRERIELPDGSELGTWLSVSPVPHELAIMSDMTGSRGRLHHVAYWYGVDQHLNDVAEVLRDYDIAIEAGPSKHGITQSPFLYCYEPAGNRVELFGGYGYLVLEADWTPRTWTEENLAVGGSMYGLALPDTFFAYGTPPVEITQEAKTSVFEHAPQTVPLP